jgi:tetratricopeptide (TPR) repeat protein
MSELATANTEFHDPERIKLLTDLKAVLNCNVSSTVHAHLWLSDIDELKALVLRYQGKYEAAEEMSQRALKGREKVLGVEHPDTLASVNNLAVVFRYQGKYEAAEEMSQRALEGRKKALGVEHPDTLASVGNLAVVLQYQGKYEAAEEMRRRALEGVEG